MAAGVTDIGKGIRTVRPRGAARTLLVCGKCLKRHPDGKALRKAMKGACKRLGATGAGKARLVRLGCIDLCPRRAVVLADGASLAAGTVLLAATPEEAIGAVGRLLDPNGEAEPPIPVP